MNAVERLNLKLFFGMLGMLALFALLNSSAYAANAPIHCSTFYGDKEITVGQDYIAFHKQADGRSLSSTVEAKTRKKLNGIDKIVYIDGNKHKIHINDLNGLSESKDYLAVTNQEGHKVTYPLVCQSAI